jgi:hypothetical protein
MDWTQTLTIIGSTFAAIAWIDSRHREDRRIDQEKWKWLFDWAHFEVNDLKAKQRRNDK